MAKSTSDCSSMIACAKARSQYCSQPCRRKSSRAATSVAQAFTSMHPFERAAGWSGVLVLAEVAEVDEVEDFESAGSNDRLFTTP